MIRRSGVATISRVFGRGIGYLVQILLARLLAPEGFGLFAIGWTFLRLFSIVGHLGLDSGVIKFGSKYLGKNPKKLRDTVVISLTGAFLSGGVFGIVLYFCAPWLANEFFRKPDLMFIFRGFALIFPLVTTLRVAAAVSSFAGKISCGAISEDIVPPVVQFLSFLLFFHAGMGIKAALLSIGISYGVAFVIGLLCVIQALPQPVRWGKLQIMELIPILKFSLPAIIGVTLSAFNLWGDRILVGYFSTETDTGIYQSISVITMFTTILLSGIKISIAPSISQMHYDNDLNGIEVLGKATIRWILYLSMPILIFVFINAEKIIVMLFSREYQSGAIPLMILTVGQFFYLAFGAIDQIFLMTGKQNEWLRISLLVFVLTIFLDTIFIPRSGLIGASIVSSVMMFLMGCFAYTRLRSDSKFSLLDKDHIKIVFSSILTLLILCLLTSQLELEKNASVLIIFLATVILHTTMLLALGINETDKALIQQYIKKHLINF